MKNYFEYNQKRIIPNFFDQKLIRFWLEFVEYVEFLVITIFTISWPTIRKSTIFWPIYDELSTTDVKTFVWKNDERQERHILIFQLWIEYWDIFDKMMKVFKLKFNTWAIV